MITCYWLLNHKPTEGQKKELQDSFQVEKIVFPSESISSYWESIPPVPLLSIEHMENICYWLSSMKKDDVAVVQGEMTATFYCVSFLLERGNKVLSSVTERHADETRTGETIVRSYVFRHLCFRPYRQCKLREG